MRSLPLFALACSLVIGCGSVAEPVTPAQDGTTSDDGVADVSSLEGGGGCDVCLPSRLEFWHDGGLAQYYDKDAIEPCATFQLRRYDGSATGAPSQSCDSAIRHCGGDVVDASDGITIEEIVRAVSHADVALAFAKGKVLYGVDPRAWDGTVLHVEMGGKIIEIGQACAGQSGCVDAPAGVKALGELLIALDGNKRMSDACPTFTPGTL